MEGRALFSSCRRHSTVSPTAASPTPAGYPEAKHGTESASRSQCTIPRQNHCRHQLQVENSQVTHFCLAELGGSPGTTSDPVIHWLCFIGKGTQHEIKWFTCRVLLPHRVSKHHFGTSLTWKLLHPRWSTISLQTLLSRYHRWCHWLLVMNSVSCFFFFHQRLRKRPRFQSSYMWSSCPLNYLRTCLWIPSQGGPRGCPQSCSLVTIYNTPVTQEFQVLFKAVCLEQAQNQNRLVMTP